MHRLLLRTGVFILLACTCMVFIFSQTAGGDPVKRVDLSGIAQGTTWHITYFNSGPAVTQMQVDSILSVIDSALSIYKPYSAITAFNNSDSGIQIDGHFKKVAARSLQVYKRTKGYFDITIFPIVEAWGFAGKPFAGIPDSAAILSLMTCVGSDYLSLENNFLHKTKPCVKIDVNSIAQGYSVDVVAAFLEKNGIRNYLVEIGGEVHVRGHKYPGKKPFTVGIETPPEDDLASPPMERILPLHEGAITTSGNYRKYHELKGRRWSHLMDPRTGYPAQNELISVTVFAKDAFTADAYDTPLMIMGLGAAMRFAEQSKDLAVFFIYQDRNGKIADTASSRFYKLFGR